MAITFVAFTSAASSGAPVITIPASVQVGDLMLATLGGSDSIGSMNTPPTGWSLATTANSTAGLNPCFQALVYKVAVGGDTGGSTTVTFGVSGGGRPTAVCFGAYRGCAASGFINQTATAFSASEGSGPAVSPAVTPSVSNTWVVQFWATVNDAGTFVGAVTPPTNNRGSQAASILSASGISDQVGPASGVSSGTQNATIGGTTSGWTAITLALAPAVVAPFVPATWNGGHKPAFNPAGIRRGKQALYVPPIVFGVFVPGSGTRSGHTPVFNPGGIRRGRTFQFLVPPINLGIFVPGTGTRSGHPPVFNPAGIRRGRSFQLVKPTPLFGAGFPQYVRNPSSRLGLGASPARRGRSFSGRMLSPEFGVGYFQFLRNPSSRLGLGSAPSRRGRYFTSPYFQQGATGTGVLLYSISGINPGVQIAYVLIQVMPAGSTVINANGFPFYPSPEIVQVGPSGNWNAWLQTVAAFTSPFTYYLITEYRTDGRTANSYKVRIPAGTTGLVNIKDVMV